MAGVNGLLCVFLLLAALTPAAAQQVSLVKNGKAEAAIVLPADAPPPLRHGAEELQTHLRLMSGAELPILSADTPADHLPKYQLVLQTDASLGEEEFHLYTEPPRLIISGGGKRGTLYGCYALLEDVLGCRWYTARISKIPKRKTLVVGPLDRREKPAFEYREPYYTEAFDKDWAVRNRTNGNAQHLDESVGGKVRYGKFVHTFSELVPPDEYYDTHPEYFSLINGKRMKGYYQLCLTNPDVLRIVIAKVRQWIQENPDATIFSVSQNDTYYNCQCDNCKAVEKEEGAPSGVVLRFVNAVADAIAKDYPHVLIDTLAYQWTEDPPLHVRPRPNVRIRLAPIGACFGHPIDKCDANKHVFENLSAWSRITNQLYIWHYSTNFANYLQPLPDLDEIAGDIPLFRQHGVVGLFYEGCYAPGGGGEMSELKAYLMAKLMWNPDRPAQPIITDFLNGVYGKAAPYIQRWLDLLHADVRSKNVHVRIYDPPTAPYLSEATLAEGVRLFDAAERATASDPVALDQVQRARLALEYVQLMRSAPHYAIEGDQYRPSGGLHADLVQKVTEKITRYQIGQVREGQPVAVFLNRIAQPAKAHTVITLENAQLRVDIVPDLGGRLVRLMDKRAGVNLLREPLVTEGGYPAAGGYEEYASAEYRGPGWNETYAVRDSEAETAPRTSVTLAARMPTGIEVQRQYTLKDDTLQIHTTATNTSDQPQAVTLRGHPEFAVPPHVTPQVIFRDRSGKEVNMPVEGETFLRGDTLPDGAWTLQLGRLHLTQHFDPAQVATALLNGTLTERRVNLELYSVTQFLAPQATLTLDQDWQITRSAP